VEMLCTAESRQLHVEGLGAVQTVYACYQHQNNDSTTSTDCPAFVLLHGFDSSLLEFRRFAPRLSIAGDVYAVDLAGWGFTDCGFASDPNIPLGPPQKRAHLRAFVEQIVRRPVVLLGTSLGGTVALDFALHHQDLVDKLVLIDAQGFIDGIGPLASMPRFLSVLGVKVLRSVQLRQMANQMAYHDKEQYATEDAMRIGRLHTHLPGWTDANVAFMRSGGYSGIASRLSEIQRPVLVVWGRQDEILSPEYADKFIQALPNARLEWVENCGHVPALEQPQQLLDAVTAFVSTQRAESGAEVARNF
jgi:pimeloyl-ACP methyl ester carboxylesterase